MRNKKEVWVRWCKECDKWKESNHKYGIYCSECNIRKSEERILMSGIPQVN